jgi:hypothetical protein
LDEKVNGKDPESGRVKDPKGGRVVFLLISYINYRLVFIVLIVDGQAVSKQAFRLAPEN